MSDVSLRERSVSYGGDETPRKVTATTRRDSNDYSYTAEYTFEVDGSSAVLTAINTDTKKYHVQAEAETARVARDAVADLAFIQAVVMFPAIEP